MVVVLVLLVSSLAIGSGRGHCNGGGYGGGCCGKFNSGTYSGGVDCGFGINGGGCGGEVCVCGWFSGGGCSRACSVLVVMFVVWAIIFVTSLIIQLF